MIAYLPQRDNPNKLKSMPSDFPWIVEKATAGKDYSGWVLMGEDSFEAFVASFNLEEVELEKARLREYATMHRRSEVKNSLLEYVAASNKARMVDGIWTSADIISLSNDVDLLKIVGDIQSLSFEIAISNIMSISNPLITADIKQDWIEKLTENLFLE